MENRAIDPLEKRKHLLINFLYYGVILGAVIFVCRYALGTLAPFLIALLVSLLLKPVVRFLVGKCHVHKGAAGSVVVIVFYALIGFILVILGIKIFSVAKAFFTRLPALYFGVIVPWINQAFDSVEAFAARLDSPTAAAYEVFSSNLIDTLGQSIATLSKRAVSLVTNFTLKTPGVLLDVLITIIATIFLSIDFPKIKSFLLDQLSPEKRDLARNVRIHLGRTLWRYTRSYAIILLVTFTEIAVGLSIIGIENAIGIALIIAVFDILPVVGSGMVLLPWTIITLLQGDYMQALGLGILYIVVIVVRNIIEPKIVGDRVGLHPIVTLLSMVVGVYVFGGIGLLGLPITLALLQSLNNQGVIHLFKKAKPEDGVNAPESDPIDVVPSCETPAPDGVTDDAPETNEAGSADGKAPGA